MGEVQLAQLSPQHRELLDAASVSMDNAYNPYSKFYVGAALRTIDGQIISGTNVENAAYGSTICAERGAIMRAVAQGKTMYGSLAIVARGESFDTQQITGPCGSCRQMLFEFSQVAGKDLEIILATTRLDKIVTTSIRELLPFAFGPLDLGIDVTKYQR